MELLTTTRQEGTTHKKGIVRRFLQDKCGQAISEVAMMMPLLLLLLAYAADYGYFFLAAANIASSARNAAQYSILGYEGPAQTSEAVVGPASTTSSVTALALADMASLNSYATTTSVEVCSKALGMNTTTTTIPKCATYLNGTLQGTNTYVPKVDPEAPRFVLQSVDVTYTVQPPIPMSFFGVSFMPPLTFHREVSMRSMD